MSWRALAAALLGLATAACGGVSYRVARDVPQPDHIAVLPFAGEGDLTLREIARGLLLSRLRTRGYHTPETAWVDRVLSEHGWLGDPERFDPTALPIADAIKALGVDAVVIGREVDDSSFNFLLLRRHAVGGVLAITDAAGRTYWSTDHSASRFGGLLITSGQVFEEVRAQGAHATPMATLALIDEFVADVAVTVPARESTPLAEGPPLIQEARASLQALADGGARLVVEARSRADAVLRFDIEHNVAGVPMVALPEDPGRHRGERDLPAGATAPRVVLRARDAFGRETAADVAL